MEEKIEEYLKNEKKIESPAVRKMLREKVMKYEDIAKEFVGWLESRAYSGNGLEVNGWTAKRIYEIAPQIDGIGVFNFLVTLRDNPEEAGKFIEERFRVL